MTTLKKSHSSTKAGILRSAFYLLLLLSTCAIPFALAQWNFDGRTTSAMPSRQVQRTLTFADRIAYQRAIEEVYWRHRIWPKENLKSKPSLDEVMSAKQIENKVKDYLRNWQLLEAYWRKPITPEQLQAEMDRMARDTKQPEVLRELFEALGNDPFVIAECLARPVLTARLLDDLSAKDKGERLTLLQTQAAGSKLTVPRFGTGTYTLPVVDPCTDDTWTATTTGNAPEARYRHTAVWTGSEMIVWGGDHVFNGFDHYLNSGGRYDPSIDNWASTSTTNAPSARGMHTAVWTGTEMIIWGGDDGTNTYPTAGGKYNPLTDTWTATSTTNVPIGRVRSTAVWTGSEMIVWGGISHGVDRNTGGRYNPSTDSWTATSITNAPAGRDSHTAVWTGNEMIIWGGDNFGGDLNSGGRYDPGTDSWTATSATNAPSARLYHTGVWTGNEMIIWGGIGGTPCTAFDDGGSYDPGTDSWTATTRTNAPGGRGYHTAVWNGNEMIVWGGTPCSGPQFNSGGRYDPMTDSWVATSTNGAPSARQQQTAVWTGSEMIIWAGNGNLNTGGRYCAQSGATPTPTPTATATGTATPTSTATATATPTATATTTSTPTPTPTSTFTPCPCGTPSPMPRPTPAPRPSPPPHVTPPPPPTTTTPTAAPRPTSPPHQTPVPPPPSPRPTPAPRP